MRCRSPLQRGKGESSDKGGSSFLIWGENGPFIAWLGCWRTGMVAETTGQPRQRTVVERRVKGATAAVAASPPAPFRSSGSKQLGIIVEISVRDISFLPMV